MISVSQAGAAQISKVESHTFSIERVNLIVAPGVCIRKFQPRSQGSLLAVLTERERELGNEIV